MTDSADFFGEHLPHRRVIAIFRGCGPGRTLELCRRAWDLGISLVEIPVQGEDDLAALAGAVALGRAEGRLVGAGTVTSPRLLLEVADAGAAFTVAPGLDERVVEGSRQLGLPHLPGVATGTEVQRAMELGFHWLKAFPAAVLGPAWFAAMRGPFPAVRFVATGGVDTGNATAFLAAGAAAVALGSAFDDVPDAAILGLTQAS